MEIDLVGHEGGNPRGEFCFTLTVTDIAIGWTENRTVRNKAQVHVVAATAEAVEHLPFPIRGIDSDNGSEFINAHLLRYCTEHELKFTRSRSGNKNDGAHVEEKNWTTVRQLVGYLRYDTAGELLLLNRIWALQSLIGNHFYPQQKLISKVRDGAKISKRYDKAATPNNRVMAHPEVRALPRRRLSSSTTRPIRPPCNERFMPWSTNSSPWPRPRANPPRNRGSPAPTAGPFQVRQRSNGGQRPLLSSTFVISQLRTKCQPVRQ